MDFKLEVLKTNWKFYYGDIPEAWDKGFDDSGWQEVTLPHDWSVTMPFSKEYSSGTGYAAGGIGWYRGYFKLSESCRGKRIFLNFDGVYKNSQVWVNSYYKGFHPYGYTPFSYDITDDAVFGNDVNEISVCVDRSELSDSRWFTGAGITRKVTITVCEAVHLKEYGMFFYTPEAKADKASLCFQNELHNETDKTQTVTVTNELYRHDQTLAASFSDTVTVESGAAAVCENRGTIENPELWSPNAPYLYTIKTFFTLENGDRYLSGISNAGIRQFRFDPDTGFYLNGSPMKIKGVCVHHDAGALGAAVTKEVWLRRLMKLKKMGCNAIRMSHNPHMPELYDLCDSLGFLVMDEAFDEWEGCKNKWSTGHNVYPPRHQGYFRYFHEWHGRDLSAMIRRDRNHPSVILWSIGNELDYPNDPYCHPLFQSMTGNNDKNKPEAERQYNPNRPNAERLSSLAAMLAREAREADATRPITLAAAFPELTSQLGFLDHLDVAGYNYKEHLYEESHRDFPHLPIIGSENSHSYEAWKAVTDNAYISGQFLWTGIDYMGEAHGWPVRASGAGLLTMAGFEKPEYYRRMSFWSDTPMAHLCTSPAGAPDNGQTGNETWNYAENEVMEVRCYTNLPQASLYLNGACLGTETRDFTKDCITFLVNFVPGRLEVRATDGKVTADDVLETVYAAGRLSITAFCADENTGASNCTTEASGIIQAEVSVLDSMGRLVAGDSSMIHAEVSGGTLLGIENGDISDCTEYSAPYRRAYRGRLILFVRRDPGAPMTKITVRHESLSPAVLISAS